MLFTGLGSTSVAGCCIGKLAGVQSQRKSMESCCAMLSSTSEPAGTQPASLWTDAPGMADIRPPLLIPPNLQPISLHRRLSVQPVTRQQWDFVLGLEEQQPGGASS